MTTGIIIAVIVISLLVLLGKKGRRIVEDYEAKLGPTNANEYAKLGRGEVERELFGDGNIELEIKFNGTNIPDGSLVTLIINGSRIEDFKVRRGSVYEKINSKSGATIPPVKAGDTAEIMFDGTSILAGTFYLD